MIRIFDGRAMAELVIEESAFEGVKEIGNTVAEDLCMVTGLAPRIIGTVGEASGNTAVFVGTVGKSQYLDELEQRGLIDLSLLRGKREVFMIKIIDLPATAMANSAAMQLLVIAGSDKRGTIYGMFQLSELCGVSPLVYFGDAIPEKKQFLDVEIVGQPAYNGTGAVASTSSSAYSNMYVSKEPSVYYRGFFINDEWPAFGNWATEKFGGVNAKCYRKIFELLLRLKGNYMWPAMWNSNFSEDGPGIENARLADTLGVVMGTSHHEPLFRAGNEWQQQYKEYGDDNTWSFVSNADAITRFWENGVKRNKDFESVITIGMRGEADSKLLPEDATMKDNIEVVKKAILAQDKILYEQFKDGNNIYVQETPSGSDYAEVLKNIPRMLAIYKEVEDYYYGDDTCQGLKDWDELKDTIFLLSDDNHGNLRNLPTEDERQHPGGYGMYYHFDYHGAPISYEWTNCNRLTKTWEQMTTAYEAGVRKMWIVNVGDLKEMEYPLSFFMDLAYDYETYGVNGLNKIQSYVYTWIDRQFGKRITDSQKKDLFTVLEGYTRFNALRTPETMNDRIYHPVHYREGERVLSEAKEILATADRLKSELSGEALLTYESMIYYAAVASLNLVIAWILTGFNHSLAKRGSVYANSYINEIEDRIILDKQLVKEFHQIAGGKWNHCLSSAHTGFRTWDDREWFYPATVKVSPISGAKAIVSFRGHDRYHLGAHWQDMAPIECDDFLYPGTNGVFLDIDTKGDVSFDYEIIPDDKALRFSNLRGRVEAGRSVVSIMRNIRNAGESASAINTDTAADVLKSKGRVKISFDNGQKTHVDFVCLLPVAEEKAENGTDNKLCRVGGSYNYCCISASDYTDKKDTEEGSFEVVEHLGREGSAIKAFPPMKIFSDASMAPSVTYSIEADKEGEYGICLYLLTRNPYYKGGRLGFYVGTGEEKIDPVYSVSDTYYTEWQDEDWAQGVLRGGRVVTHTINLKKGHNNITIYAMEPGVIIEKIVIKRKDIDLPESYLGPKVNY